MINRLALPLLAIVLLIFCTGWGIMFTSGGQNPFPAATPTPSALSPIDQCAANLGTGAPLPLTLTVANNSNGTPEGLLLIHKGTNGTDPNQSSLNGGMDTFGNTWVNDIGQPNGVNKNSGGCLNADWVLVSKTTGSDQVTANNPGTGLLNAAILCTIKNFGAYDVSSGNSYTAGGNALSGAVSPSVAADAAIAMYYIDNGGSAASFAFSNNSSNSTAAPGTPTDIHFTGSSLSNSATTGQLIGATFETGLAVNNSIGFQRSFSPSGNFCGGIFALSSAPLPATTLTAACVPNPVNIGGQSNCTATATLSNQTQQNVTTLSGWTSMNTSVATIGASTGVASGLTAGTSGITATYPAGSGPPPPPPPAGISFVGRAQAIANSNPGTATVNFGTLSPGNVSPQTGDFLLLYILNAGTGTPACPTNWTATTCGGQGIAACFHVQASGDPTTVAFTGVFPKVVVRDYRNAFGVDACALGPSTASATATSATIPALAATALPSETYVGFWANTSQSNVITTTPTDLIDTTQDPSQWDTFEGDKQIASASTVPGLETASAAANQTWAAVGITLKPIVTNTFNPNGGVAAPSGTQWVMTYDDEFANDPAGQPNSSKWNGGAGGLPMCHTPAISAGPAPGCNSNFTGNIQDCLGYAGGTVGTGECTNIYSGSFTGAKGTASFGDTIIPGTGLAVQDYNGNSSTIFNYDSVGATDPWAGLQNAGIYTQHFGFFEWSAKLPTNAAGEGDGLHPDLWCTTPNRTVLCNNTNGQCDEVDVNEWFSNYGNTSTGFFIADPGGVHGNTNTSYSLPGNVALSSGFHTYAVDWFPTGTGQGSMQLYVDGVASGPPFALTNASWANGVYCFAGWMQEIGNGFGQAVDSTTSNTNPLYVKYFREWLGE